MIKIIMLLAIILILLFIVISRINNFNLFSNIPKYLKVLIFVSLTVISLLSIRIFNNTDSKGTYVPAKFDGEELIPGKVEIEK